MKTPRWYLWQCAAWLVSGLPLQWFFTAFNGLSFFSLPDAPAPDGASARQWLFFMLILYHPVLTAPVAAWLAWRKRANQS